MTPRGDEAAANAAQVHRENDLLGGKRDYTWDSEMEPFHMGGANYTNTYMDTKSYFDKRKRITRIQIFMLPIASLLSENETTCILSFHFVSQLVVVK